jgi:protocadherin alpha
MLLYMSNAPYHLAGDGKVGAVLEPNPGRCSLVPGTEDNVTFNEYLDDIHYDYPSVYQLRELLRSTETNIVFAVTEGVAQPYRDLQEELGSFARQTILERNSENLVSVIQEAYNEISQEIQLFPRETYEGLEFEFTPGEGCNSDDVDVCTGVSIGKNVSFDVTVTMTSCLEGNMTAFLQSPAFGTVELEIVPLCECPCKNEVMENAEVCNNGTGDLICGQCECPPGMSGDKCQCPVAVTPICGPEGGLECSGAGRGRCNCGDCMCFVQEELLRTRGIVEPYFGDYCQCDHFTSCAGSLTDDGTLCFGRGECDCDTDMCMCMEEEPTTGVVYGGPLCDCDPKKCYSEEHNMVCVLLDSTVVNLGRQACNPCTGCRCTPPTIKTSNSTCETVCVFNEPCARCIKNLQDASTDCMSCNPRLFRLFTGSSQPDDTERCSFTDGDGCSHAFFVTLSMEVLVDDERDCPATGGVGNLAWIIPVAVVAGLLVLGFIILLIVLLIVCINDRREYHRFKRDLEDANWDQQENPMYVSPSQQYSNITYRPKKEPIKED